jgi:hypothetical protein
MWAEWAARDEQPILPIFSNPCITRALALRVYLTCFPQVLETWKSPGISKNAFKAWKKSRNL